MSSELDQEKIILCCLVAHLAEYIETGNPFDLDAAKSLMLLPELQEILKPGPLIPQSRSGKSIAEMVQSGGG